MPCPVALASMLALSMPLAAQTAKAPPGKTGQAIKVETFAKGLVHPWGMAFLPDGRLLVTERPGRLRIVGKDGTLSAPLQGIPKVYASGQGGLLDVQLGPDFASSGMIYLSMQTRAMDPGTAPAWPGRSSSPRATAGVSSRCR